MNRIRSILKNALLAFVLVTVGFVVGKESALRTIRDGKADVPSQGVSGKPAPVNVYYLHATVRCDTCNSIEKMTHDVLESQFSEALNTGRIEWKVVDFQEDEELARRFKVVSSGVIVARIGKDGQESFKSLDDVWTLVDSPPAFAEYVAGAVRECLAAAEIRE